MNDPLVQTYIVGIAIHIAATAIAFYLWTEHRGERFLLFWALAWASGLVRWAVHYPAELNPMLRGLESFLISVTMFFTVLGSYDLLPSKPWKHRSVVGGTLALLLAYSGIANMVGMPLEMGYALYASVLTIAGACMWVAYRSTRLSGYAFGAATFLYEFVVVSLLLLVLGRDIANNIIVPLYNIPLMLSIATIAYQRHKVQLIESERTLQKIFDTAPTPILMLRPPDGVIERANPAALDALGISPETAIGKTAVQHGIVPDPPSRQAIYARLESGRRVIGQEIVILRAGREQRTVSVNADRIVLASGDRYIVSFYDLTELRRAEKDLRESAEQRRQLYVRLANVEDDERRALHAELHDQVGANLSALRLQLDLAARMLSGGDAPGAQHHLGSAREVAGETMAMARDLMAALRPPALDDYGLVAALRTFAVSQSSRLNLPIHVAGDDLTPRPRPPVETALFRIAHEAVINVARHASATRVAIDIAQRDGQVILTIDDDGVGFSFDAPGNRPDHWGLKSMRERALAIGGTLHVRTEPGTGTRVMAEAPHEAA